MLTRFLTWIKMRWKTRGSAPRSRRAWELGRRIENSGRVKVLNTEFQDRYCEPQKLAYDRWYREEKARIKRQNTRDAVADHQRAIAIANAHNRLKTLNDKQVSAIMEEYDTDPTQPGPDEIVRDQNGRVVIYTKDNNIVPYTPYKFTA